MRHCLGPNWASDEIRFGHPAGAVRTATYASLGAPVMLDQPEHAVIFNVCALSRPVPGSDPAEVPLLARHLARLNRDSLHTAFLNRVQQEVRCRLPYGHARFGEVAARFGMARSPSIVGCADVGLSPVIWSVDVATSRPPDMCATRGSRLRKLRCCLALPSCVHSAEPFGNGWVFHRRDFAARWARPVALHLGGECGLSGDSFLRTGPLRVARHWPPARLPWLLTAVVGLHSLPRSLSSGFLSRGVS